MVPEAVEAGRPVVIVNAEPTPFDGVATAVVRGSASTVLPRLVAARP
jgi:NAD-dependent deacetylase